MSLDEFADGRFELRDASVDGTANCLLLGESALDEVQPGSIGRGEMHVKARPLGSASFESGPVCGFRSYR
jgi:hypothetical protein